MKALSIGKYIRGFSTLELVIALALMSLIFGGVMLSVWGSQYWAIASQTSNEGLYKAKTRLEDMRAQASANFLSVVTQSVQKDADAACTSGSLCYFIESTVTSLSACAKYAQATVSWRVAGYATTSTSLFTDLASPREMLARGGDCLLAAPAGAWNNVHLRNSYLLPEVGSSTDVLGGIAYIALRQSPYLAIVTQSGPVTFTNGFALSEPVNALDVVHSAASHRTYAYLAVASSSNQFRILDVTDPRAPVLIAKTTLPGVAGANPHGFRIVYYNNRVYITTLRTVGPELHVFDVSAPETPLFFGSKELNISPYGLAVRDENDNGTRRTLAYIATANDGRELMVMDVTYPMNMTELPGATTNLVGSQGAHAIYALGNIIYIGRDSSSGDDVYSLNTQTVFSATHGLPEAFPPVDIGNEVTSLFASGELLFVGSSKSNKQLQIFSNATGQLKPLASLPIPGLGSASFDVEGNSVYALSSASPQLRIIESN